MILSQTLSSPVPRNPAIDEIGTRSLKEMVKERTEELEREVIQEALNRCRGKKAPAARMLGVSRPTLDSKIESYGLVLKKT